MDDIIKKRRIIRMAGKNIRTGRDGYLWGRPARISNILKEDEFDRYDISGDDVISERWICSDDSKYPSKYLDSCKNVCSLEELFRKYSKKIFPSAHIEKYGPYLGTVMKLIDTNPNPKLGSLSLQVHPKAGYPKTPSKPEMWLSLSDECKIYAGFQNDVSERDVRDALSGGKIFGMLNELDFSGGKTVLIAGGIVHSIRYGSFLAEWSKAPSKENRVKGGLENATFTLADDTDGRGPRLGKVDVEGSMDVLRHAGGFSTVDIENIFSKARIIYEDKASNQILRIFETDEIVVEELIVSVSLCVDNSNMLSCFYLYDGDISIEYNCMTERISAEEEFIAPIYIGRMKIANEGKPARLFRWFKPV